MRIALITWTTGFGDDLTHVIVAHNLTDDQLAHNARRWAALSLSAKAYKACSIEIMSVAVTDLETHQVVKLPE